MFPAPVWDRERKSTIRISSRQHAIDLNVHPIYALAGGINDLASECEPRLRYCLEYALGCPTTRVTHADPKARRHVGATRGPNCLRWTTGRRKPGIRLAHERVTETIAVLIRREDTDLHSHTGLRSAQAFAVSHEYN
jgi:hypothetical protein